MKAQLVWYCKSKTDDTPRGKKHFVYGKFGNRTACGLSPYGKVWYFGDVVDVENSEDVCESCISILKKKE